VRVDHAGVSGDDGFAAFVAGHQRGLLQLAYVLTGDRSAAQDLVQTAFMRTYSHWGRIAGQDPAAYVRRIVVNANHDRWRRSRGREQPEGPEPVPAGDHADALVDRNAIVLALAELTERERAVVVHRFLLDLNEADTARELGVPAGTVKSTTHRAMGKLRASAHLAANRQEAP
jgi:RNA polymerase sigma-70 factor (sigma-E family)